MQTQADTIKSYEEIRRVVRGGPILTLTQRIMLIFILLLGILGGCFLADCWGNIPTAQEQSQLQVRKFNGDMQLFLQRDLYPPSKTEKAYQEQLTRETAKSAAQLRHQRQNAALRKRIAARKAFMKAKRKCKMAKILFLASISHPMHKP